MKNETLSIAFLISLVVHISVILVGAVVVHENNSGPKEFLSVNLIDAPREQPPPQIKKTSPSHPSKLHKSKQPAAAAKVSVHKPDPRQSSLPPVPATEEPVKMETSPSFASTSQIEGGGAEAGTGNLFGKGDVGVVPGPGSAGAAGLPAQSVLRTNREAKPIQTVRANYPPIALRAGLESDVTLRVIVDIDGNVTHAEITKGGGAGFDEEALKAVKQSRFEPAQKNGENVLAEFSYVFRFRMQR